MEGLAGARAAEGCREGARSEDLVLRYQTLCHIGVEGRCSEEGLAAISHRVAEGHAGRRGEGQGAPWARGGV